MINKIFSFLFLISIISSNFTKADELNLEMAVEEDKVTQDFELESLSMGSDHAQKVKVNPIGSDNSSKDCVDLSSSTAVSGLNDPSKVAKKYELSICAIFKNEAKNLESWIEYHRTFGVDHFYLYNTRSRDSFQQILEPYINKGIVTLVNWPEACSYQEDQYRWALSTQIPAYENAVNFIARNETKWLLFIDIDEFLVSSEINIKDLLRIYDGFSCISFSSDVKTLSKKAKPTKSLESNSSNTENFNELVRKMIFKPDLCIGFDWPPYQCRFERSQSTMSIDHQKLKVKRYGNDSHLENKNKSIHDDDYKPDVRYMVEDQDQPMYPQVPEFLKRLKQK